MHVKLLILDITKTICVPYSTQFKTFETKQDSMLW